jgi:glycerol-3-phosphate acyltransferase PlsY
LRPLFVVIVAYLVGSIPFGFLIVQAKEGGDIRQTGSGGTGATNVSRRAGKFAGVLTLVLDALKGAAAVLFAKMFVDGHLQNATWLVVGAGVAAIVGHIFPLWLGFRGGKGVATTVGVFMVLAPLPLLSAGVILIAIVWISRYVSLGSIVGVATVPLFIWLQDRFVRPFADVKALVVGSIVCAALVIFAHRANIARLLAGSENRI